MLPIAGCIIFNNLLQVSTMFIFIAANQKTYK